MADKRETARTNKQTSRTTGRTSSKTATRDRYPQWKVDLFRAGISERQQSRSGQSSGRAVRAPGA